jgi:hypothetical protein
MIMQALGPTTPEGDELLSEVFLRLNQTDFPSRYLPKGPNGERLMLPSSARLIIGDEGIKVDVIAEDDHGGYYPSNYEPPDFDDVDPPIISMSFRKNVILRLVIGGRTRWHPTALLVIADPTGIDEGFTLTFESTDSNNPEWHIKKLVKHVRERLGVKIEQVSAGQPDVEDMPF